MLSTKKLLQLTSKFHLVPIKLLLAASMLMSLAALAVASPDWFSSVVFQSSSQQQPLAILPPVLSPINKVDYCGRPIENAVYWRLIR